MSTKGTHSPVANRPDMTDFEQTIGERARCFRSSPKISNDPDTRYFSIPNILPFHQRNENQARPELFHSASIFVHSRIRIKNIFLPLQNRSYDS